MKKNIITVLTAISIILIPGGNNLLVIAGDNDTSFSKHIYIAQNTTSEQKKTDNQNASDNNEPPKSVSDLPLPKTKNALATEKPVEGGITIPEANPESAPAVLEQNPFTFIKPPDPSEINITAKQQESSGQTPAQAAPVQQVPVQQTPAQTPPAVSQSVVPAQNQPVQPLAAVQTTPAVPVPSPSLSD